MIGSLCTGYGGLDGAAQAVYGGDVAWVSDIDPHVNRLLGVRYPDTPNIGDITASPDAEAVDILTAGFPCQPVSVAGRRKGTDDDQWIFDDICAFVGRMDPPPRLLLFENVPGLLSANGGDAMARVVVGLARRGYVGRWRLLRASDIGACHRRERWFCVATHADGSGREPEPKPWETDWSPVFPLGDRANATHAGGSGGRRLPTPVARDSRLGFPRQLPNVIDTLPSRFDRWGDYAEAVARHERTLGRPTPDPTIDGRLNPVFVEWMMMLPAGWVTDLDLPRSAQLKILGNGVVPAQAEAAFLALTLPTCRYREAR